MKKTLLASIMLATVASGVWAANAPIEGLGDFKLGVLTPQGLDVLLKAKVISKKSITQSQPLFSKVLACSKTASYDIGDYKVAGITLKNCTSSFHEGSLMELICKDRNDDLNKALNLKYGGRPTFSNDKGECSSIKDLSSQDFWNDMQNNNSISAYISINHSKDCKSEDTTKSTQVVSHNLIQLNHACYKEEQAEKTKSKVDLNKL